MSVWCSQMLPGEVYLNPSNNCWVMDVSDLSQWAGFPLCSRSEELSPFFCSHVRCCGSDSTENPTRLAGSSSRACGAVAEDKGTSTKAARGAGSKAQGSCWVVVYFLIVNGFFLFSRYFRDLK